VTTGDWTACGFCALPVDGYSLCPQCLSHRRTGLPLADRAGSLVYADEPSSQTYRMMRGYKEPRTRDTFEPIVEALLAVGLRGHFTCANKLAGTNDSGWTVVTVDGSIAAHFEHTVAITGEGPRILTDDAGVLVR